MSYCVPSQIPVIVKPSTFIENILSCFDWILSIWTLKFFLWEESKVILSYKSMINEALAYNELELPKNFSHDPPLK